MKTKNKKRIRVRKIYRHRLYGIQIEYSILDNIDEYVDVDVYATCPNKEQYLIRVYQYAGDDDDWFPTPTYRYAPDQFQPFSPDEVNPAPEVYAAVNTLLPKIHKIILREKRRRKVLAS